MQFKAMSPSSSLLMLRLRKQSRSSNSFIGRFLSLAFLTLLLLQNALPSDAVSRFGILTRNRRSTNAFLTIKGDWGTSYYSNSKPTSLSSSGWTIDNEEDADSEDDSDRTSKTSKTNAYHVIGASRSGFFLSDDNFNNGRTQRRRRGAGYGVADGSIATVDAAGDDEESCGHTSSKLVKCTRYGQRVKMSNSKKAHGHEGQ